MARSNRQARRRRPQQDEGEGAPVRRSVFVRSLAWLWNRYSPNGEFPISSALSMALHILLLALIPLLIAQLVPSDPTPPAVDVVHVVSEAPSAAANEDFGEMSDDALQATEEDSLQPEEMLTSTPVETVQDVEPVEVQETVSPTADQQQVKQAAEQARQAAQQAADALSRAKARLNENLNKGQGGPQGSGETGRAARPARWVIRFNSSSAAEYLAQVEGLGGVLAIPAQGERYRYFPQPSSNPKKNELRDLSGENRLYWSSDKPPDPDVYRLLGVAVPEFDIMFLPPEMEEKLLRLELAYMNLEEDEIASTHFGIVQRGGSYDVQVINQIPK